MKFDKLLSRLVESAEYHQLRPDDEHDITAIVRDNHHRYEYCDGVLYELNSPDDIVVSISDVEHTEYNEFYPDQIERYVEYISDGGILETFPVQTMPLGEAFNLMEMCEHLDDDFDLAWEILGQLEGDLSTTIGTLYYDGDEHGVDESILSKISDVDDLNKHYGKSYKEQYNDNEEYMTTDGTFYWDENIYNAFKAVLEYWKDAGEYTLTDMNHRFAALKELGKSYCYVDPS